MKLLTKLALIAKTLARGSRKQKSRPILPPESKDDGASVEHQDDGTVLTGKSELEQNKVADLLQRKLGTDSPSREKGDDSWVN